MGIDTMSELHGPTPLTFAAASLSRTHDRQADLAGLSALERNGPSVAREMANIAPAFMFSAVALRYNGATPVIRSHKTLKAAYRSLAAICNSTGPHHVRDSYAACVVCPNGQPLNWHECRAALGKA